MVTAINSGAQKSRVLIATSALDDHDPEGDCIGRVFREAGHDVSRVSASPNC